MIMFVSICKNMISNEEEMLILFFTFIYKHISGQYPTWGVIFKFARQVVDEKNKGDIEVLGNEECGNTSKR